MSTKYAGQVALNKLMQLVKNAIPTKVSQLTNDAGFITDADIPEGAAASTTAPLMDGTAAVGVSNAFARGDHVHPSDDSKLSLSGGTMTGELNMGNEYIRNVATLIAKYIYLGEDAGDVGAPILNHVQFAPMSSSDGKQSLVLTGGYSRTVNVKGINTPVDDTDAANKAYVDGKAPLIVTALSAGGADHTYAEIEAAVSAGRGVIYHNEDTTDGEVIHAPLGFLLPASKYAVFLCRNGNVIDTTTIDENGSIVTNTSVLVTSDEADAKISSAIASAITGVYTPKGTVAFASLPTASAANLGWVYNISDAFTTTASFVEGAGCSYGAGTNVVCVDAGSGAYKWDVLAGTIDLTELTEAEVQTIWDSV